MAKTADHIEGGPSPKQVGRQLRQVRRKQGLSRGDVARSAGLTRRELAAYERGRAEVPDSDLWCLAGSCGVDVTELLPEREPLKVGSDLSSLSVGESMRYLRGPSEPDGLLHEYLSMIYELRNLPPGSRVPLREPDLIALAEALGGSPETIERRLRELIGASDEEASRLRAMILPSLSIEQGSAAASQFESNPVADFAARDEAANDFFSMPRSSDPFLPPPEPGMDTLVPSGDPYSALPPPPDEAHDPPMSPSPAPGEHSAFDLAPPTEGAAFDLAPPTTDALDQLPPPVAEPLDQLAPPDPFVAAPLDMPAWSDAQEPAAAAEPDPLATLRSDPFAPQNEPLDVVPPDVSVPEPVAPVAPVAEWQAPPSPMAAEPAATMESAGFQVFDNLDLTTVPEEPEQAAASTWSVPAEPVVGDAEEATVNEAFVVDVPDLVEETPTPLAYRAPDTGEEISWGSQEPAPTYAAQSVSYTSYTDDASVGVGTRPSTAAPVVNGNVTAPGYYQQAGSDWQVGGMFPATSTARDGGIALRRADARWALADVAAPGDFTLEATFDFKSGAGFGVLFRASADDADRITAYSFDIDAIAGSGSYLLRQWDAGNQHWQALAEAPLTESARLYGRHVLTLGVYGDRLFVSMDGDTILDLDGLARCSLDHGRAPCRGNRVGVQAWATTEVTIESFRVAQH